ncbi:hypothetical protein ACJJTC_014616 [Scirpophaga incertulas]
MNKHLLVLRSDFRDLSSYVTPAASLHTPVQVPHSTEDNSGEQHDDKQVAHYRNERQHSKALEYYGNSAVAATFAVEYLRKVGACSSFRVARWRRPRPRSDRLAHGWLIMMNYILDSYRHHK